MINRAWWFLLGAAGGFAFGLLWKSVVLFGLGVVLFIFAIVGWRNPHLVGGRPRRK